MKNNILKITVEEKEQKRVDAFLAQKFSDFSRVFLSNLIKENKVTVNNKKIKSSYALKTGDIIEISFPRKEESTNPKPENIPLNIIFEDENVIVLNKQPGIVVHPAADNKEGTLVSALLHYFPKIREAVYDETSEISQNRPGLVHRLDRDTSGVLIVAKNKRSMASLSKQIQKRTVKKIYWAICYGWPKEDAGTIVSHLGRHPKNRKLIDDIGLERGKEAISDFKVLKYLHINKQKICLVEFNIKTGRTHQIRVQSKILGIPVLGDTAYGNRLSMKLSSDLEISRQLLHAHSLKITLPTESRASKFEAPLPEDLKRVLQKSSEIKAI